MGYEILKSYTLKNNNEIYTNSRCNNDDVGYRGDVMSMQNFIKCISGGTLKTGDIVNEKTGNAEELYLYIRQYEKEHNVNLYNKNIPEELVKKAIEILSKKNQERWYAMSCDSRYFSYNRGKLYTYSSDEYGQTRTINEWNLIFSKFTEKDYTFIPVNK